MVKGLDFRPKNQGFLVPAGSLLTQLFTAEEELPAAGLQDIEKKLLQSMYRALIQGLFGSS